MSRCVRLCLFALALFTLAAPTSADAQLEDLVGVYFDTGYYETEGFNQTVPHLVTAYLVLHNPTQTAGGLSGWECRVDFDGYEPTVQWNLQGSAVNYATPPQFVVGMIDPLPAGQDVLLASFDMWVDDPRPWTISLNPLYWQPSIPDAMAYIPWDDKNLLTPMTTTTGQPVVANYNWQPWCDLSQHSFSFGTQPVGATRSDEVTVTNGGGMQLVIDPVITGSSDFALNGGVTYPRYLGPGESVDVGFVYTPTTVELHQGELDLGTDCGPIALQGLGRLPIVSWTVNPESHDFGAVLVGATHTQNIRFQNTGETTLYVDPALNCPGFSTSTTPQALGPGAGINISARFSPPSTGDFTCDLELGNGLGMVPLSGSGVAATDILTPVPASVDFGLVYPGNQAYRTVRLHNLGTVDVVLRPELQDSGTPFRLTSPTPGLAMLVIAGGYRDLTFVYAPTVPGVHANQLVFDAASLSVPLTGRSTETGQGVTVIPTALDFGSVNVNSFTTRSVRVTNYNLEPVTILPVLDPVGPHFSITQNGGPFVLAPGGYEYIWIQCYPRNTGTLNATLTLGPDAPDVPLTAEGYYHAGVVSVEPPALVFGLWPVGGDGELELQVINRGSTPVDMDVGLFPDGPPFSITAGISVGVVPPASSALIRVRFQPTEADTWARSLILGPDLPPVQISASASYSAPLCQVSETDIAFPLTPTGGGSAATVTVTNTGLATLDIDPTLDSDQFSLLTEPAALEPGEALDVTVVFTPSLIGPHSAVLNLGDAACADVLLGGEAFTGSPVGTSEDVVGLYFDPAFESPWAMEVLADVPFEGYLVLHNPTVSDDLTGWEMRVITEASVILAGVEYAGDGFNFSIPPVFTVGLQTPQPAAANILLATFTFVSPEPPEASPIALVPKLNPSIPDAMAVISGSEHALRPIYPVTGQPVVAWVTWHDPTVALVAPAPLAVLEGGQVVLSWPIPSDATGGTHLWRTGPDGHEERLTAAPLTGRDGATFRDTPTGFEPGSTLGYSYAIMSDGVELYRSGKAEVRLPDVTYMTRLLPNVPNPFNPETEIRFELAKAGHVRITVYDIMGRRIARIYDEARGAGPAKAVWRGRDERGRAVPSGSYYVRMETPEGVDTRKVMLLK